LISDNEIIGKPLAKMATRCRDRSKKPQASEDQQKSTIGHAWFEGIRRLATLTMSFDSMSANNFSLLSTAAEAHGHSKNRVPWIPNNAEELPPT